MLQELQKRMKEFHMVSPGDDLLVGVSGGADSVCLALALHGLQKEMGFSMEVVHVEHGIRGAESKSDAAFVETLCQKLRVPYQIHAVDVPAFAAERGLGLEEAARIKRYEIFARIAKEKGAKVALAHHQEDNAETILFQMVRGSSLTGLCGMRPLREDENGVCYIRPLLFFRREEIEAFLQEYNTEWCVDSTNAELEYSRNFLRAKVLPDLTKMNARAIEHINQSAFHLTEIKDYLDMETERLWPQIVKEEGFLTVDAEALQSLHAVMQRQIAYKAIVTMAKQMKDISTKHVEDFLDLCKGQSGKRISLPYGVTAWKEFSEVHVAIASHEDVRLEEYQVSAKMLEDIFLNSKNELELSLGNCEERIICRVFEKKSESAEIPQKAYTKWFDYDKIKKGFCIRTRRSGDYFISDGSGHHKKLKAYFIDEKIPVTKRESYWLLAKDSEVIWLIGGRISEHVKVSQETKYIIEITYDGGQKDE